MLGEPALQKRQKLIPIRQKKCICHNSGICISKSSPFVLWKDSHCSTVQTTCLPLIVLETTYDSRNVWRLVLQLTFLGLPLCTSGLEPVLFQAQLVEKCFALKRREMRGFWHTFILPEHIWAFWSNNRTISLAGNVRTIASTPNSVFQRGQLYSVKWFLS